jgi:hypothetical protein
LCFTNHPELHYWPLNGYQQLKVLVGVSLPSQHLPLRMLTSAWRPAHCKTANSALHIPHSSAATYAHTTVDDAESGAPCSVHLEVFTNSLSLSLLVLHLQVSQWTSACLEGCMKRLTGLNKPYKYVVTCIIMQKTGAQLKHASGSSSSTAAAVLRSRQQQR